MKNSPSKRSIYKKWGITAQTLELWIAQGIDPLDDKAMAAKVAAKQPSAPTASGDELFDAKLRKLTAEARTAEMRADQQEGQLIALDDICIMLTKIGCTLKAQLTRFRHDLPPVLYGRTQQEMSGVIAGAVDRTLQGICDQLEQIKIDPPKPTA